MKFRPLALLLLLVALLLIPFLNKPFHIDDPFYVWTAQQIQKKPLDPFGYNVNWFGHVQPAAQIVTAPPLYSYLLAGWGTIFGLDEISCHAFNLLVALLLVAGIYVLAVRLRCDPVVTTLISISSPIFMLSTSIVMADLMMSMFLVWSLAVWTKAQEENSAPGYIGAVALACASVLTKYNGVLLLALLLLSNVFHYRRWNWKMAWLLVPCCVIGLYVWAISGVYHQNFIGVTASYIHVGRAGASYPFVGPLVTGFVFVGALVVAGFPFILRSLKKRELVVLLVAAVAIAFAESWGGPVKKLWLLQRMLWLCGGLSLAWVAVREAYLRRDATSFLIVSWLGLTFVFTAAVNWSVNGRSLVTLVPAAGLLLAHTQPDLGNWPQKRLVLWSLPSLLLALLVTRSDYEMAWAARRGAERIAVGFQQANLGNRRLWFEGHWGFQYYMEKNGAHAMDLNRTPFQTGDIVAIPLNNSNLIKPPRQDAALWRTFAIPYSLPITVMNNETGAGYYADHWGGLPFVFGMRGFEKFNIYVMQINRLGLV
jgi:4-amino-4-deoxy-L-arabinose transferase-like glycosyltransferase